MRLLWLCFAVVLVAACDTSLVSSVDLSQKEPVVRFELRLTGEVATLFTDDAQRASQLDSLFNSYIGHSPRLSNDGQVRVYYAELTADQLTAAQGVTGVARMELTGKGQDRHLEVKLVDPALLRSALSETPDANSVKTMLENVSVDFRVTAPSIVSKDLEPTSKAFKVSEKDGSVTVSRVLSDNAPPALFTVQTSAAHQQMWPFILAAVLVVVSLTSLYRRRRGI